MTKLRLIKKRELGREEPFDLRGLGQEEVFLRSAPFACLAIHGARDQSQWGNVVKTYDLETEASEHKQVMHLVCRIRNNGEHKRQAVTLFVVGLHLNHQFPTLKLHLGQVSQLHYQMERTFNLRPASVHTPDGIIKDWLTSPQVFSVTGPVTHHLNQAGFSLSKQESVVALTRTQIDQLYHDMTTMPALPETRRRVG
jgi:hypothetical protein